MIGHPHKPEIPNDSRVWVLPNNRYIYKSENKYLIQPPRDNWYIDFYSIEEAIEWYEGALERAST